jgi:signal transduction histidine kinase
VSGVVLDSMRVEVRRSEWRIMVLRSLSLLSLVCLPVPIVLGSLRSPEAYAPMLGPAAAVVVAGVAGATARRLSVGARALILGGPLYVFACSSVYLHGTTPGGLLMLAMIAVVAGLVRGAAAGAAALVLTAVTFGVVGALGREHAIARLVADLPSPLSWLRMAITYFVSTGVLLWVVTLALRRVEDALAEQRHTEGRLRAADALRRLTVEAASLGTWSLDAATRRFAWDEMIQSFPWTAPPATLEALLARVPGEDRARVAAEFEAVLRREKPELKLEHGYLVGEQRTWVEARGRLTRIAGRDHLVGTVADVRERREAAERRASLHATLLGIATGEDVARGDLDAGLRAITAAGARLLDVERCGVWLFSADGAVLENQDLHQRRSGAHGRIGRIAREAYPAYFAALGAQRAVAAADALRDPRTAELADYLGQHGIAALLDASIHVGGRLVGVVCHEHVGPTPRRWTSDEEDAAAQLADAAARMIEAAERRRAQRELEVAYAQLARLHRRMDLVREEERRNIARELHDELGGTLTAVKLHLTLAGREPARAAERIAEATHIVDRAVHTTRELTRALRPPLLDEIGLVPALQSFVEEQARASGLGVRLEAPAAPPRASSEIETAAFRVVQEAVTNALRHAGATQVDVALRAGARLEIVVRDDGRGFDAPAALAAEATDDAGIGLVGMRERARALGGRFAVSSTPGGGTEIRVELPLEIAA